VAKHADNRKIWINLRDGFPHPYGLADAESFIRSALDRVPETLFAIAVDGLAVGSIGFRLQEDVERCSAEIGCWIAEDHWGRGIGTEALRGVTEYAMTTHNLTRMYAVPYEWNAASCRILEKAGYVLEGRMRKSAIKDGRVIDQFMYACVR
jgi:RimJ/RimL family protein N-acetyltransferase